MSAFAPWSCRRPDSVSPPPNKYMPSKNGGRHTENRMSLTCMANGQFRQRLRTPRVPTLDRLLDERRVLPGNSNRNPARIPTLPPTGLLGSVAERRLVRCGAGVSWELSDTHNLNSWMCEDETHLAICFRISYKIAIG
jgi:hypothetical protein